MRDIVERLRNPVWTGGSSEGGPEVVMDSSHAQVNMREAADEIVRLRATIELLRSVAGAISVEDVTFDQIKKDARG